MHAPCQPVATDARARNLLQRKAIRAAGVRWQGPLPTCPCPVVGSMPIAGHAAACRRRAGRGPERQGEAEQTPEGARATPSLTSCGGRARAAACGAAGWNVACPGARPRRGARPLPTRSPPAPGGCAAAPSPPARAGGAGAGRQRPARRGLRGQSSAGHLQDRAG